jgi:hypothetical protein
MARYLLVNAVATPVITASSAYASGNALGGLLTFKGLTNAGFGKLISAVLTDKGNQKSAIDLLLFNKALGTTQTDKTAIAIASGDLLNLIGRISFPSASYTTIGNSSNAECTLSNLQLAMIANALTASNDVYGQLVCRGTPTYASTSDIQVALSAEFVRD